MKFTELDIAGVFLIDLEPHHDERGFFARTFCAEEFEKQRLVSGIAQCSTSFNKRKGTLRGLHYQAPPHEEAKVVRCTAGSIFDVVVDLRADSHTRNQWRSSELSASNRRMLYIPAGVAHGFQTLTDDAEVFYQISVAYDSSSSRGVRWNDPVFGIAWPDPESPIISQRDREYQMIAKRST